MKRNFPVISDGDFLDLTINLLILHKWKDFTLILPRIIGYNKEYYSHTTMLPICQIFSAELWQWEIFLIYYHYDVSYYNPVTKIKLWYWHGGFAFSHTDTMELHWNYHLLSPGKKSQHMKETFDRITLKHI